ncbi:Oligopeptide transport ATP-binding protein [Corynebacterium pseudotuberculosis]|uniref:dipeptide ABC transporter ATP-binding protein n=1 Tax=Corynebacterium pseudotuberculosis TaxID=1719 RepID=UPI00065E7879|nr:ABC transporter ATP-binding protein [Corynebacterium pseudotuberculosis]AKP08018.1 Oligopeptide transport ATP-binding protein [Corynebacterium pseudotuberculosis]
MTNPVLSVQNLNVTFPSEAGNVNAVRGVSFNLYPGQTLGIVGESGSGKSVASMAVMGLLPDYATITGSVQLHNRELIGLSDDAMSKIRGKEIGMIFQDPLSALTPVFNVGSQIVEALRCHQKITKAKAWDTAIELLDLVGIPDPKRRALAFPHEFSGGMRQRVVIAIAIANNPSVLIADEPTTALDVTIQAQILDLIKMAQKETNAATIMITHDMGVVAGTADNVMVMYAGRPVEYAGVHELFSEPKMPYTVGLLGSIPSVRKREKVSLTTIEGSPPIVVNLPDECSFAPRCPIATAECLKTEPGLLSINDKHQAACIRSTEISHGELDGAPIFPTPPVHEGALMRIPREKRSCVLSVSDLTKTFPLVKGALLKRTVGEVRAVNGLTFDIKEGECFAIVGESGCGKTTTLLEIMDLAPQAPTQIQLGEKDVAGISKRQRRLLRKDIQIVFQDPMGALDPRLTVAEILREPLDSLGWDGDKNERIRELIQLVGLNPAHIDRFPGHFSGGQRQRISLARALAANPKLIVLDEPVSALDVSVQAGMLNLLDELKARLGISYLFVAHDLSVIRHISDRAAVMYLGRFVEQGDTDFLFDNPQHPYTKALLSAIPLADPIAERNRRRIILTDSQPSPTEEITGCAFRGRCPLYVTLGDAHQRRCRTEEPEVRSLDNSDNPDHLHACHFAGTPLN